MVYIALHPLLTLCRACPRRHPSNTTDQQPLTSADGAPALRCGSQLLFVTSRAGATPYVHVGCRGPPLLAADGSVLRQGPADVLLGPLQAPLPRHVPYLVNRCGAPYGLCSLDGSADPLAVCGVQGRAWLGPGRVPLLLRQAGMSRHGQQQHQLVTADGQLVLGPQGQQIMVTLAASAADAGMPGSKTVAGVVEAATGQPLHDMHGQPLTVDPATLQLLRAIGQPAFDRKGQPLRLRWGTAVPPGGWPTADLLLLLLLVVLGTALVRAGGWEINKVAKRQLVVTTDMCLDALHCCTDSLLMNLCAAVIRTNRMHPDDALTSSDCPQPPEPHTLCSCVQPAAPPSPQAASIWPCCWWLQQPQLQQQLLRAPAWHCSSPPHAASCRALCCWTPTAAPCAMPMGSACVWCAARAPQAVNRTASSAAPVGPCASGAAATRRMAFSWAACLCCWVVLEVMCCWTRAGSPCWVPTTSA